MPEPQQASAVELVRIVNDTELGISPRGGLGEVPADGAVLEWSLPASTGGRKTSAFIVRATRGECFPGGVAATAAGVENELSLYVPVCGLDEAVTYGHPSASGQDMSRMTAVGIQGWPGWSTDGTATSGALCDRPTDVFDAGELNDVARCACVKPGPADALNDGGAASLSVAAEEALRTGLGSPLSASHIRGQPRVATTRFRYPLSRLVGGECYTDLKVVAISDEGQIGHGLNAVDASSASSSIQSVASQGSATPGTVTFTTGLPSSTLTPSAPERPSVALTGTAAM